MNQEDLFYAKVNMDLLKNSKNVKEVRLTPINDKNNYLFQGLDTPIRKFSIHIIFDENSSDHDIMTTLQDAHFNMRHASKSRNSIQAGMVVRLKNKAGYWCIITNCRSCFSGNDWVDRLNFEANGCSYPNCINNRDFAETYIKK
jgi:hypothetical protein